MRIVVAGIKRSASTVQYNIIRIALEQVGFTVKGFGQSYDPTTPIGKNEAHLIKIHPYRPRLAEVADLIFLTNRKDEEILASLDRMWDSGNPERIVNMRKHYYNWLQHTTGRFEYEYQFWTHHRREYTRRIIEQLGVDADVDSVLEEFDAIELPEDKQDPVTLFFPNHITKG